MVLIPRLKKSVANVPQEKKEKVFFKCVCCGQEKRTRKNTIIKQIL